MFDIDSWVFFGIYLVCLEQAGHVIQIFLCPSTSLCLPLIRWIASSCFLDLFRTFPCSFIKSSCFWYHWYVCNMHDTAPDSRPFSAWIHLSVSFFLSLIRWIGSSCSLALSGGFPVNFHLKHHVQRRSVFVPALPIMSCVPTYWTPSSHDITPTGSHHHRGGGCWQ